VAGLFGLSLAPFGFRLRPALVFLAALSFALFLLAIHAFTFRQVHLEDRIFGRLRGLVGLRELTAGREGLGRRAQRLDELGQLACRNQYAGGHQHAPSDHAQDGPDRAVTHDIIEFWARVVDGSWERWRKLRIDARRR
jgi:hypothetical protein